MPLLVAAMLCALAVTLGTISASRAPAVVHTIGSSYTVMQMNLCLSGLASCYGRVAYPAVVHEAERRIRDAEPDAVTFNEACQRDVAQIARRTGYHMRFSRVIYLGVRLQCIYPGGRGLFGDAVLTKAPITHSDSRDFHAQSDIERRRWLCVTTGAVDVCTSHLSTRDTAVTANTNDAQCGELRELLARRAHARTVVFGGDVNRRGSCAPPGFWTRTDTAATQSRGVQHIYGSHPYLRWPTTEVVPARHSDHDVLLVHARRLPTARVRARPAPGPSKSPVHRMPPDGRGAVFIGPRG